MDNTCNLQFAKKEVSTQQREKIHRMITKTTYFMIRQYKEGQITNDGKAL